MLNEAIVLKSIDTAEKINPPESSKLKIER